MLKRIFTLNNKFTKSFLSFLAGVLLDLVFPPFNIWPALIIVPILWIYLLKLPSLTGRRVSLLSTLYTGFLLGFGFFLPILAFTRLVAGNFAWISFAIFEAIYIAVWAVVSAWLSNHYLFWAENSRRKILQNSATVQRSKIYYVYQGTLLISLMLCALLFTVMEWIRGSLPFHGFPWLRLGFAAVYSPFLPLSAYLGESGISFLIIALAFLIAFSGNRLYYAMKNFSTKQMITAYAVFSLIIIVIFLGFTTLRYILFSSNILSPGVFTVAYVQAGSLDPHSDKPPVERFWQKTEELGEQLQLQDSQHLDLVFWPENSSDIDPFSDPQVWAYINQAAQAVKVPVVIGALIHNADGRITNSAILWDSHFPPEESEDIEKSYLLQKRHDKIYIQPFGEYIPWRGFFRILTAKVDLANHLSPGNDSGIIRVDKAKIGTAICYEVGFDGFYHRILENNANIFAVPTNNATFGRSKMTYIELEMSQFRAVEFHREVIVAATTGVSAFVDEQGRIFGKSQIGEQKTQIESLRLHNDKTLAYYLYPWLDWTQFIICVLGLYSGWRVTHRAGN